MTLKKKIEINEESLVSYNINEFDSMWSPYENNLKLEQKLIIEYPMVLFGKDGITCESNKIGLAVHIYSKTSNFQETVKVASFENKNLGWNLILIITSSPLQLGDCKP